MGGEGFTASNVGELPLDEKSYVMEDEINTISSVPASSGYIRKLTAERLKAERPIFEGSESITDMDRSARIGHPLAESIAVAPEVRTPVVSQTTTQILTLDRGRFPISESMKVLGWTQSDCLSWQRDGSSAVLLLEDGADLHIDASNRILVPMTLRRLLGITPSESVLLITTYSPVPHVRLIPVSRLSTYLTF